MKKSKVVLVLLAAMTLGCGGDDAADGEPALPPSGPGNDAPRATATLSEEAPELSVDIVWFSVDQGSDVMRFLANISNLSDRPAVGVRTEWTAYDSSNVIVGNRTSNMPVIPAGQTHPYVGGAGGLNFTGTPARVEVLIADPGRLDESAPNPYLQVDDERIEQQYQTSYNVRATLSTSDREIDPSRVKHSMVLFDADDEIILANFIGKVRAPSVVPAGQRFGVEFYVVETPRVPTRAEVTAWISD